MKPAYNIWDLRDQAKRKIPKAIWEFIERGSEDDILIRHNNEALRAIKFDLRTLRDVTKRDMSIELFGKTRPSPLIIAPTGIADLACYHGESAIAGAAAAAGLPFSLATSSTTSVDTIAQITSGGTGFWQQMYLWERRDLSWQVVDRAAELGAEALIVTVDVPIWPNREFNKRNGMANPIKANPLLAWSIMQKPGWMTTVLGRYVLNGGLPTFANYPAEVAKTGRVTNSPSVTWDDVRELKRRFPGKLLLKGMLNREDVIAAADHGVDGVVVSNHGGRTFDAAPASIEVLAEIVDAVGDRMTVIFDSGIRRGSDVLKAMAIGAHAVMIGRATLYGAGAGGQPGAARAIDILKEEISTAMAMVGATSLRELDRGFLRRETVPGL
ncbi:alpha-hydroxy acid oxidase [Novosphingobium sp. JCM 18896]|uniref:alpha-hydroxy acid oxidase n=1 Tax=Novosphingobium sp. JCM 18896 TaxID=2989731 RepID=UPI0022232FF6|nr:alpha-hydroxy acid oxidase [Novosphingobium sp. JCM 18896]MCW1429782.1 alpha-hydroxy-acid oxidizing protein [Novosphingobium sp. JCM 18896]